LIDEKKRKKLLRSWALQWWDFTSQPIDEIYSYYGAKVCLTMTLSFITLYENDVFHSPYPMKE